MSCSKKRPYFLGRFNEETGAYEPDEFDRSLKNVNRRRG